MFTGVTDWILNLHGWLAVAIVFAVPALEASAFVGFVFPGEIAVILGGVLAYQHRVTLPAVLAAAIAGAIVGDSLGYAFGRRWGRRILYRSTGRMVNRRHLRRAETYLAERGGKAVFFGRFTAALRVLIPGLAGLSGMRYRTFAFYNVAGGIAWASVMVFAGYAAGTSWRHVERVVSRLGLGLLAAVLLVLAGAWAARRLRRRYGAVGGMLARIGSSPRVTRVRDRFPAQSAWLVRRLDRATPTGLPLTLAAAAGAGCAWAFAGLTQDVIADEEIVRFDAPVTNWVVAHRTAWLTGLMRVITQLGSGWVLVPLVTVAALLVWRRTRDVWPGVQLVAAGVGALVLAHAAKAFVNRPRPSVGLVHPVGSSYPSGHSTQAVATWGMLAIVLTAGRPLRTRILAGAGAAVIALAIGMSRIYLGAHWLTDVLGGYALGGLWLATVLALRLRHDATVAEARARSPGQPAPVAGPAGMAESGPTAAGGGPDR